VADRNAPLSELGRLRLARCIVEQGWPVARAAEPQRPTPPAGVASGPSLRCFDSWTAWLERLEVRTWSVDPPSRPRLTMGCVRGAVWGRSKPQPDPGRLHGLVNDRQQLGREGIEVDLVA
jgi:hypothetical protein